ncbi:GNAT family N-acetyltransferase [Paenibacillus tarimensis]|uniref:GNAT family N-acetyltransferase n=1 Tax=Paenibacillus tarimensis TaxID=416012 RepID=UPI001F33F9FE|nr:GNAT family N-acetyltransferase [Paenibacillus tarimensis]MCF2946045.1 GNAT family N-acetyltransferase [Paenibacillus tarimensis]
MIIRNYNSNDLEALTALMADLGYPTNTASMEHRMKLIQSNPTNVTFVAEVQGNVVGMIGVREVYYYEEDGTAAQISALVTKQEHQGKGIGKALVRYVESWALEKGIQVLTLTSGIKEERVKAHEFYKAIGFEITGYRFVKKL